MLGWGFGVLDLLRDWRYAVPLVLNLTGSVWFFLVVGAAGEFFFGFGLVWFSYDVCYFWGRIDC